MQNLLVIVNKARSMRRIIEPDVAQLTPIPGEVLASQGMAGRANLPERIKSLLDSALVVRAVG
jgi:hypothetical protein